MAKMILIAGMILMVVPLAVTPALGQTTYTWDDQNGNKKWNTAANWDPDGVPDAGDTAIIDGGVAIYDVKITDDDAVCKILTLGSTASLTIIGQKFQLGDLSDPSPNDPAPVVSTVDGIIHFKKDGTDQAVLEVGQWVKFEGGGNLNASKATSTDHEGVIKRSTYGTGIIVDEGISVHGSFELLVSIQHNSFISSGSNVFGSFDSDDVMQFGQNDGAFSPDLEISTTTAANARSQFKVTKGRLEFYAVKFLETAPNWFIPAVGVGTPEIDVDNLVSPSTAYFVDVPFDISVAKGGLLDFHHDFSCTGKLTVGDDHDGPTVKLDSGLLVKFYTPAE